MSEHYSLVVDGVWHHVEGRLHLGNLVLANDGKAHIVVCRSRTEFDAFLVREGIAAQDILWERP